MLPQSAICCMPTMWNCECLSHQVLLTDRQSLLPLLRCNGSAQSTTKNPKMVAQFCRSFKEFRKSCGFFFDLFELWRLGAVCFATHSLGLHACWKRMTKLQRVEGIKGRERNGMSCSVNLWWWWVVQSPPDMSFQAVHCHRCHVGPLFHCCIAEGDSQFWRANLWVHSAEYFVDSQNGNLLLTSIRPTLGLHFPCNNEGSCIHHIVHY